MLVVPSPYFLMFGRTPELVDTARNHKSKRRNSRLAWDEASHRNLRKHESRCRHPLASFRPMRVRSAGKSVGRSYQWATLKPIKCLRRFSLSLERRAVGPTELKADVGRVVDVLQIFGDAE